MINKPTGNSLNTSLFDDFDTIEDGEVNESLVRAKTILKKLTELVIEHNGHLWEPLIVWLEGSPWAWKSHLIDMAEKILNSNWIKTISSKTKKNLFPQHQFEYERADIIFSDDLFYWANSLQEASKDWDKWAYDLKGLPDFLFHLYDTKKIWIVSSNFPIDEILKLIAKWDTIWRLRDRIDHLLASVQPLKLERKQSYRKKLASGWTKLTGLFSKAVNEALWDKTILN
ncbi:MAG: hypothetical protein ACD_49C00029G0040 [uncultured bacterium (gcode 4)]|uniref:Chromosomal replication initiator protein DnaA domain-containing protein n=1 Tax=uncultured bacterium (gcode 4) TaxID=1234023 RepID=K2AY13_9BACT|nr:MAG: hypothetical protein ACD_49C00029G0040 [uncultured bacterium (gcode 4)]